MRGGGARRDAALMTTNPSRAAGVLTTWRQLPWVLIAGLAALALLRPVVSIVLYQLDVSDPPAVPVLITAAISLVWVGVVGLSNVRRPVQVLVATGLAYGVASILLSAVVSPVLTGRLQGPLAMPVAIVPVLIFNAGWGAVTGVLAWVIQRWRSTRAGRPARRFGAAGAHDRDERS